MTDEFLPVNNTYELRFTLRALADLSVSGDVSPADIDEIIRSTRYRSLVAKFVELRHRNPNGTEAPMRNVGRPDIYSLHGRDGVRACTWFDTANGVCWFLGCVDQHDYGAFEARAASGDLLPSVIDIEILTYSAMTSTHLSKQGFMSWFPERWHGRGTPREGWSEASYDSRWSYSRSHLTVIS